MSFHSHVRFGWRKNLNLQRKMWKYSVIIHVIFVHRWWSTLPRLPSWALTENPGWSLCKPPQHCVSCCHTGFHPSRWLWPVPVWFQVFLKWPHLAWRLSAAGLLAPLLTELAANPWPNTKVIEACRVSSSYSGDILTLVSLAAVYKMLLSANKVP